MKYDDFFETPTKLKKEEFKGFIILPYQSDRPLCVDHLTLMTQWGDFTEEKGELKGKRFEEWFCIDCYEAWDAKDIAGGGGGLTLGGDFVGKTEREFFRIKDDKIN